MDRKMVWFQKKRKDDVSVLLGLVKKHKLFLITLKHSFPGSFLSTDSRNINLFAIFLGLFFNPENQNIQRILKIYNGILLNT